MRLLIPSHLFISCRIPRPVLAEPAGAVLVSHPTQTCPPARALGSQQTPLECRSPAAAPHRRGTLATQVGDRSRSRPETTQGRRPRCRAPIAGIGCARAATLTPYWRANTARYGRYLGLHAQPDAHERMLPDQVECLRPHLLSPSQSCRTANRLAQVLLGSHSVRARPSPLAAQSAQLPPP